MKHQFYLGEWQVDASSNTLILGKTKRTIEPKAMDVLLLLCQQHGEVVSADDIVAQCWPNTPVGDNPVHKSITHLRRALGDKANAPVYIETIRKRGYRVIAHVEFMTDEQTRATQIQWQGDSPFPGLKAFTSEQSAVFFGRTAIVRQLINRITDQFVRKRPLTLVIGPSGSGKSSLVHAGLLPKLLDSKSGSGIRAIDYLSVDMSDISPNKLTEELAAHLLDLEIDGMPLFDGQSTDSLLTSLLNDPHSVIEAAKQKLANNDTLNNTVYPCFPVVIDRLEVYLSSTDVSDVQKSALFALLEQLAQSNIFLVVLVTRNDFYPLLANYPVLMKGKEKGTHFDIAPPTVAELSQMIRLPAIAAGLNWEIDEQTSNALDDIILADAAKEPNCLPLLQYTLQELYLQRNNDLLQIHTYQKLGGIDGAIGHKAEQLYLQLPSKVQSKLEKILPLIVTITDDGTNLTSKTASWSALSDEHETAFVQQMVESRLFVSHLYQNTPCFKVAHEAVLRRWPRVQKWMQQHQSALVTQKRVAEQTALWLQDNKSSSFLLAEGKPLTDALTLLHDDSVRLSPNEQALIRASQSKQRTKRLFKGVTVALLACLTVVSFAAMLNSQQSQQLAERKRIEAENLMGFMIGDFADKLRSVKRMDLLEGISEQALAYVETAQQESDSGWFTHPPPDPSFELRFQHALSLQAVAEVRYYRDDADTAKQLYEEADKRLGALLNEQPSNFELLKAAGANAFWLGQLSSLSNNAIAAQDFFERYLEYSEKLYSINANSQIAHIESSYAYNALGVVSFQQKKYNEAISYFTKSLEYKRSALSLSKENSISLHSDIADTYSWLANSHKKIGDIKRAELAYVEGLTTVEEVLDKGISNAYLREVHVYLLRQFAMFNESSGDLHLAVSSNNEAIKELEKLLLEDPENTIWQEDYLKSLVYQLYLDSLVSDKIILNTMRIFEDIEDKVFSNLKFHTQQLKLVSFLQNINKWDESQNALVKIEKSFPIDEYKLVSDAIFSKYVNHSIASIRQLLHEDKKSGALTRCRILKKIALEYSSNSDESLKAQLVAEYCLENTLSAFALEKEINKKNIKLPNYFNEIKQGELNER